MTAVKTPIRDTQFSMALIVPVSQVFTSAVPWHLPLAAGLLLTGFIIWRIHVRNTRFHAEAVESDEKKKEISELSTRKAVLDARVKELDEKNSNLEKKKRSLGEYLC